MVFCSPKSSRPRCKGVQFEVFVARAVMARLVSSLPRWATFGMLASLALGATGCGVDEPLDVELPAGTYAVWDEATPSGPGSSQADPVIRTTEGIGRDSSSEGDRSVRTLQTPSIQPFFDAISIASGISDWIDPTLCQSEISFCGGELKGEWEVQNSCDSQKQDPVLLWEMAQELVELRGSVCVTAPRWVSTTWKGELSFRVNVAADNREEHSTLRVVVGPECLTSTLGSTRTVQTTEENCALLNNEFTTCTATPGRCICNSESYRLGQGSGVYRYLPDNETIEISNQSERQTIPYHYCVENNERVVWWEPDTGDRVVLVRKGSQQRLLDLPKELPIVAPR